ncbi:MAG: phosphonate degradation HD-domain oxygenase [Polaromonas sp.]
MTLSLDDISGLFLSDGSAQYGGEAVTQLQHALQCAHLAECAGASHELVAAALLHDLGHLIAANRPAKQDGVDDLHQFLALPFLRGVFPDAVLEPIRMHVDAKRYLCHADRFYRAALSTASERSLVLQGGPFSEMEARDFIARAFAVDAVALRRWDDSAKDPSAMPPAWEHYLSVLDKARCVASQATPMGVTALSR